MSARAGAMCARLVTERQAILLATPEARADYAAYLARLEVTYAGDPAMAAYVERSRALLAGREAPPC